MIAIFHLSYQLISKQGLAHLARHLAQTLEVCGLVWVLPSKGAWGGDPLTIPFTLKCLASE